MAIFNKRDFNTILYIIFKNISGILIFNPFYLTDLF